MSILTDDLTNKDITIRLQTINRCNAHCTTCPYTKTHALDDLVIMSDNIWDQIINELSYIGFSGWFLFCVQMEPLLDPKLYNRILDIKLKTKAHVIVMTNGSLLTNDKIQEFLELEIDIVYLSLLSLNQTNYEKWTGLDYNSTISRIKYLKSITSFTDFKVIIAGHDYYDNIKNINIVFPTYINEVDYWIVSPDSRAGSMVGQEAIKGKGCLNNIFYNKYKFCTQPFNAVTILADGTYLLCDLDWERKVALGNISNLSIVEVYTKMEKYRDQFQNNLYIENICKRCSKEYEFKK